MNKIHDTNDSLDLNSFLESLLIEFNYSNESREFIMITDFVNWDLERGKREFKRVVFSRVQKFQRLFGTGSTLRDTEFSYHVDNYPGTHIIQDIKKSEVSGHDKFIINLDNYFGGFDFECENVNIETRIGNGIEVEKDNWIYSDIITNELFKFSHPFPPKD
jgi:hypothetical protein